MDAWDILLTFKEIKNQQKELFNEKILPNYPWPSRKIKQRQAGHERFWKKDTTEKPFLQGFVTVFEKNIKSQVVVPKMKRRDHSYSRKYKHEIAKELSQTI